MALSAALYVFVTYATTIGFGKAALEKGAWFAQASLMGTLARTYVGNWLVPALDGPIRAADPSPEATG